MAGKPCAVCVLCAYSATTIYYATISCDVEQLHPVPLHAERNYWPLIRWRYTLDKDHHDGVTLRKRLILRTGSTTWADPARIDGTSDAI